jgi:hypothetical protein
MAGVAVAVSALAGAAAMADAPNLKGRWSGPLANVVIGERSSQFPNAAGTVETPFLGGKTFTYEITGQDGARVWGTKKSDSAAEPFAAVVSSDGQTLLGADSNGVLIGKMIDPETIEVLFAHPGPMPGGEGLIAATVVLKRQR